MGSGSKRVKFWAENPLALLERFDVVPREEMTLEEKLNAVTRLVIIIFIILLVARYKHATIFLLSALLIILILYRFQNPNKAHKEKRDRSPIRMQDRSRYSRDSDNFQQERFYTQGGHGGLGGEQESIEVEAKNAKSNPRKPYPPTVPHDFVVRSGYGSVLNSDPKYEQYVKPFDQSSQKPVQAVAEPPKSKFLPKEDDTIIRKRAEVRKKAFTGGPRVNYKMPTRAARYHGYQTQEFEDFEVNAENDAEEESDRESKTNFPVKTDAPVAEIQLADPIPQAVQVAEKPRRQFLPSNYEAGMPPAKIDQTPKNERAKPRAPGIGRNTRLKPSPIDNNDPSRKYNHDTMQFSKAVKAEPGARSQANADRQSRRNTMFST